MKNSSSKKPRRIEKFPVWTYEQAMQAIPYFTSVMRSIRELFLEMRSLRLRAKRLDSTPGPATRQSIIEHDEAVREADRLQMQIADAASELAELNVHCINAPGGIAMIPCVQSDQLAWLVFDLFAPFSLVPSDRSRIFLDKMKHREQRKSCLY